MDTSSLAIGHDADKDAKSDEDEDHCDDGQSDEKARNDSVVEERV